MIHSCKIYQEIKLKCSALIAGGTFSFLMFDRYFKYVTIESPKTTRPDPQGHGGF